MTDRATLLATINASPVLLSLLYDISLMPEQVKKGSKDERRMVSIALHFAEATTEIERLRAFVIAGVAESEIVTLRARVARLESAINWAMGCGDAFPVKLVGDGAYWWRGPLAIKAEMVYDRKKLKYIDAAKGVAP